MGKHWKLQPFLILSLSLNLSWAKTADQTLVAAAKARTVLPFKDVQDNSEKKDVAKGNFPEESKTKSGKGKPITPTPVGWMQFPESIHGDHEHGEGENDGDSNKNSDGTENGNGNGAGNKLEMTDNDAPASAAAPSNGNPGGDKKGGPAGAQANGSGKITGGSEVLSHWWPMCAFVDKNADAMGKANTILKGVVDEAARCKVSIVLFPVKVDWNSVGDDYKKVNEATRAGCNLPNDMPGSATALVPWEETAAKMCDVPKTFNEDGSVKEWDKTVAGCAELNSKSDLSRTDTSWQAEKGKGEQLGFASGNVAVSIEVPLGYKEGVVSHEAIGHSEMGRPNGRRYGKGIGEKFKDDGITEEGEGLPTGSWTEPGCLIMRKKAIPNTLANAKKYLESDHLVTYDRHKEDYFFPTDSYDVASKKGIFPPQEPPPPPGDITVPRNSNFALAQSATKRPKSNMDRNFFKKGSKEESEEATIAMGGGEKHPEKTPDSGKKAEPKKALPVAKTPTTQDKPTDTVQVPDSFPGVVTQTQGNQLAWVEDKDTTILPGKSTDKAVYGPSSPPSVSAPTNSGNAVVWSEGDDTSALSQSSGNYWSGYSTNLGAGTNTAPGSTGSNGFAGMSSTGANGSAGMTTGFFDSLKDPSKNPEEEDLLAGKRKKKPQDDFAETTKRRNPTSAYQEGGSL